MTESEIQSQAVKKLRQKYPAIKIIANPLSELQLHYKSKAAKFSVLQKAKAAGWESSQPDLILLHPDFKVAVELKTPRTNPFRPFRTGPAMWIDKTKDDATYEHVMAQLSYLDDLRRCGIVPYLLSHYDDVLKACSGALQVESYEFSYGMKPNCLVYFKKFL